MTPPFKIASAVALALMALTSVLLLRLQSLQKIGQPGAKLVATPVYGEKGDVVPGGGFIDTTQTPPRQVQAGIKLIW